MARYLYNLLACRRRITLRPEEVFETVRSCFVEAFARAVEVHLICFGDEIRAERVRIVSDAAKSGIEKISEQILVMIA